MCQCRVIGCSDVIVCKSHIIFICCGVMRWNCIRDLLPRDSVSPIKISNLINMKQFIKLDKSILIWISIRRVERLKTNEISRNPIKLRHQTWMCMQRRGGKNSACVKDPILLPHLRCAINARASPEPTATDASNPSWTLSVARNTRCL